MSDTAENGPPQTSEISRLTDDLFRQEAGKLISVLSGIFGINRLQLAEDVVQESLIRALRTWPYTGVPKNPAAWLTQTAKNLALDLIRREKLFHDKEPQIIAFMEDSMVQKFLPRARIAGQIVTANEPGKRPVPMQRQPLQSF